MRSTARQLFGVRRLAATAVPGLNKIRLLAIRSEVAEPLRRVVRSPVADCKIGTPRRRYDNVFSATAMALEAIAASGAGPRENNRHGRGQWGEDLVGHRFRRWYLWRHIGNDHRVDQSDHRLRHREPRGPGYNPERTESRRSVDLVNAGTIKTKLQAEKHRASDGEFGAKSMAAW